MLNLRFIKENPRLVKENLKKRFQEYKLSHVDKIITFHDEWITLKKKADNLRALRNRISKVINDLKKQKKDPSKELKEAEQLPDKISNLEERANILNDKIYQLQIEIPNILHKSVPLGKDAKSNKVIRKWGKPIKSKFNLKNHVEILEKLKLADFDAARKTSGQGFNYLLGQVAQLDHALQRYGVDFMLKNKFKLVVPPMLLNLKTLLGAANGLADIEEVVYKLDNEDLYLIGTAEHTLIGMNQNKLFQKENLPLKFCALTPCFRKEIGSHGVDTKGLFRMHQFNKVEQVVICTPEKSDKMLEEMQEITEKFFKTLKIPFRVIEICSGDLGNKFSRQYDIEAWFPRQNEYQEVTSAGNCTDYQAQSLNIKYSDKQEKYYVHVLNNTMVATSRAMVAILENYQQKDGSIKIPTALVPYMGGIKKIEGKKT